MLDASTPVPSDEQPELEEQVETKDPRLEYWACKGKDELAAELKSRVDNFYTFMASSAIFGRLKKSFRAYYGLSDSGMRSVGLGTLGDQDEITTMKVNHYRSIILNLLNMTTAQRPSFEVRATNTDYESQTQALLANGILDFYMREKRLERYLRDAVELALVMGEAYLKCTWEPAAGEEYGVDPQTGTVIYEGDLSYTTLNPLDVVKDINAQTAQDPAWLIVRTWKNKFDLAAKYPHQADDILHARESEKDNFDWLSVSALPSEKESDIIPVYEFYHNKSETLPNGRFAIFLNSDTVLFDGPLPYRNIPCHRIAAQDLQGTPFGYSPAFDLLCIQEALDVLYSTVISNQSTFGTQNIWTKPGSDINVNELAGGLKHVESNEKPEPLNLVATAPEIFNFMKDLEQQMETLSGVNSTVRGNPGSELKSGAALALVASQAIQFNSGLQQAWASLLEDSGTATFQILQDFARVPRVAQIMGKNNRSKMQSFTGSDIQKISRVVVDMGNPIARTTAGRVEMANQLLQTGMIKVPQEYLQVIATGRLEPLTEGQQAELLLIKAEGEELRDGRQDVPVIILDDHDLHIQEHMALVADPDTRRNGAVVTAVTQHIQQHIALKPQKVAMLAGPQPPQLPQGPGGQPQGPGAPGPHGPGVSPRPMDATNPTVAEAHGVKGPRMPNMPAQAPAGLKEAYHQVTQNAPARG